MAFPGSSNPYSSVSLSDVPYNQKWELLRPHIYRLYIDEDRPLTEVISMMQRDFSFYGNEPSYKYYINKKWKWKKNIPAAKKFAMVNILQTRAEAGKSTAMTYKGKQVDPKKLRRVMKEDARQQIAMHAPSTGIDAEASLTSHTVFPAGNMIFLNWNMPYGAMRRPVTTVSVGPSPAPIAVSTPSDVVVTTPSPTNAPSPHDVPSPMTVALKEKTRVDRAVLFVQGRHHELLNSMNRVERRNMSTWLYQFWLFSFRTAKNWGRGPHDWTADLLGFDNFQDPISILSPNTHGLTNTPNGSMPTGLPTYPPPSPLCRWTIHVEEIAYEHIPDLPAEIPCNPEDEETWTRWERSSNAPNFEEKLKRGLESNDFSTLRAADLPVAVSQIATAAQRSPDELLMEAFGFSIIGRNADLMESLAKQIFDKQDFKDFYPFHLATSYLDGSRTCCNILDILVSRMPPDISLSATYTNNLGHTILDNLMIAILKSHTSCVPSIVDDDWQKEKRFAGEEVDICGRWDADSDCVRSLLAHGEAAIPFEWKHKFCHTSAQTICHCINTIFYASYCPSINTASGLFVKRCLNCGLKLQLKPLHTLVLTAFALAQQGAVGEDLFGIVACALCLLRNGADTSVAAQISLKAFWQTDQADQCSHEELSAAELAERLASEFHHLWTRGVQTGWNIFCFILGSSPKKRRMTTSAIGMKGGEEGEDECDEEDAMEIDSEFGSETSSFDSGYCCDNAFQERAFGLNKDLGVLDAAVQTELATYRRVVEGDPWTSNNFNMEQLHLSWNNNEKLSIGLVERGMMKPFCRCGIFLDDWKHCVRADQACSSYFMNMDIWSRTTFISVPERNYD